mmetsp:Transcript_28352/g.52295  ORF Transcript_28352/g.52295 Transcript_28352/m.52295 type:complete len:314 (-) Transcript_28352:200-1141(-)
MAAHHPRQNASSFRRIPSPGGGDQQRPSLTSPLPSLPIFSASSDQTSNSSNLSSKSSSLGGNYGPSAASGTCSDSAKGKRHHHPRRKLAQDSHNRSLSKKALMENDAMVYLDGPQVYTCGNCRTHLTSHDDIISKSFHGRHGRAYLFDQCVNFTTGPSEDRNLITGLHSVSDIFCKRCQTLVGWTYAKAYEPSQKYKEGKFIIEKMFLHLEESDHYDVDRPAGERGDKWRVRSMSWGSERSLSVGSYGEAMMMGSPSGVMGSSPGGSYYSRGGGGGSSAGGSSGTPTRRSPGVAMMAPKSPISPNGIIYEYRR